MSVFDGKDTFKKSEIIITREWAMPNANTFTIPPIKKVVEQYARGGGVIVDPFANKCKYGTITNDLNPEFDTTFHLDALQFLRQLQPEIADLVLYDPPYSIRQASEMYKSYGIDKQEVNVANMRYWAECKNEVARICKTGGRVICCGWNSNGLGKNRGFTMTEILLVSHGGGKNDTIVTVEYKEEERK